MSARCSADAGSADACWPVRNKVAGKVQSIYDGQSTLDSVLSAEARLYDAEAKEIDFIADRHQAELTILTATGQLSGFLNIHVRQE